MRMATEMTKRDLEISRQLLDTIPHMMRSVRLVLREAKNSTLTVPQFRVLAYVSLQPCTSKQLADWQGVSLPAMSRMVDYLVRRQLLTRTPDTKDRRQIQLRASFKGKKEFETLHKAVQGKLAERITALRESEKKSLEAGLGVLGALFNEA